MKIGIVGVGMVGKAIRHGFTRIGHDVKPFDINMAGTTLKQALDSEAVFVCVPTPSAEDGSCDVSIVERIVGDIAKAKYRGVVVLKSTVEPGTTDRLHKRHKLLRLAFCPEFLREKATYTDFVEQHDVCIIGAYNEKDYEIVRNAHDPLPQNYAMMSPLEAEFCKYFSNMFNAMRITFANQFYDVTKAAGADYQKIKNAITKRRNIPNFYLDVNDNFRGFGGSCLPKDTKAFAAFVKKLGLTVPLFEQIVKENDRYETTIL